ncbi:transcriptional regulator, partial [Mycolicibacterium fortuitum]
MSEFGHGLFIGKFYPPHRGHHAAVTVAADRCDRVSVLVMAAAPETVPLADRVAWLRATHAAQSNVTVAGIPCDAPLD